MPSACFSAIDKDQRIGNMPKAKALKIYVFLGDF